MDWLQLISAVGIGALLTKVLDIVWLQRTMREAEKRKWFREQRLRVYTKLAEEILIPREEHGGEKDTILGMRLSEIRSYFDSLLVPATTITYRRYKTDRVSRQGHSHIQLA